jgi:hypothetical protein
MKHSPHRRELAWRPTQIGADLRVFVYDCPEARGESRRHHGCVVNPVLKAADWPAGPPDPDSDEEGCLSVPGEKFPIGRANWARVTGLDANGEPVTVEGTGLIARMLQHEIGHLDGQLYIDSWWLPTPPVPPTLLPHMAGVSRVLPGRQVSIRTHSAYNGNRKTPSPKCSRPPKALQRCRSPHHLAWAYLP